MKPGASRPSHRSTLGARGEVLLRRGWPRRVTVLDHDRRDRPAGRSPSKIRAPMRANASERLRHLAETRRIVRVAAASLRDRIDERVEALDQRDRQRRRDGGPRRRRARRAARPRAGPAAIDRDALLAQTCRTSSARPSSVSSCWLQDAAPENSRRRASSGPCISSAALSASAWMPQVSLSFSAASCATAKPRPARRPRRGCRPGSEAAAPPTSRSRAARARSSGRRCSARGGSRSSRPVGHQLQHRRKRAMNDFVAATLRSGPACSGSTISHKLGERRGGRR